MKTDYREVAGRRVVCGRLLMHGMPVWQQQQQQQQQQQEDNTICPPVIGFVCRHLAAKIDRERKRGADRIRQTAALLGAERQRRRSSAEAKRRDSYAPGALDDETALHMVVVPANTWRKTSLVRALHVG